MITTLLVANRGEIARRVIRTARTMGIRTVAVFSDPDVRSPHVGDADRAVALGGATPAESYLDQHKIVAAARASGADAIHPGYGFLSENAGFARACRANGLTFVGPSPESIETMGLKDRAKDVARTAGLPVLPDALISGDDVDAWRVAAEAVGYPLLVKATAGGGGKGMRRVDGPAELAESVAAARREAGSSFGDSTVFLERCLLAPRHVEMQVFADAHGGAVHLLERECSVQRRHQKVVEEAPSPAVDHPLREQMGKAAVALVRELGYHGAGTVEYLLDDSGPEPRFYFLEMNTRLQVEHPVTEEVTGLDLVRMQLQVAAGQPLMVSQEDISARGHAVEVRLYAEDPTREFLPTPGPLHRYTHGSVPGVRYEDGVAMSGDVPSFYDPMLAKVIAHADTRVEAALRLSAGLAGMELHGTATNRDFLVAVLRSPAFLEGDTHTDFIDLHPELRIQEPATPEPVQLAAAIAVSVARKRERDRYGRWAPPGFRQLRAHPPTTVRWQRVADGGELELSYRLSAATGGGRLELTINGIEFEFRLRDLGSDQVWVRDGQLEYRCAVTSHSDGSVWVNDSCAQRGWRPRARLPESVPDVGTDGSVSEMSGTVVALRVEPGDHVDVGDPLVVVEAMKMEHTTTAATTGIVEMVHVAVGQYVEAGATLVSIADEKKS